MGDILFAECAWKERDRNIKLSMNFERARHMCRMQEECGITRKDTVSHVQGKIIGEIQAQICIGT